MAENRLYYGDNLGILQDASKIPSGSVDLCYIDPPFNSKRNYSQIYNNIGGEDMAQAQAFVDTWEWGPDGQAGLTQILEIANLQSGKFTNQTVELMRGLRAVLGDGALLAYLVHMTLRIVEIHRVLNQTGSFYLHCDPTASHYLKLILDSVFCTQGGEYLNEIVWRYQTGGVSKRRFGRKHDVIFWYSKSSAYKFYPERILVPRTDEVLRRIKSGTPGATRAATLEKLPDDVFDIQALNAMAKERLGYPTQKPEALLERIILASSNDGDVVLDAYCGCGTTVAVAQRLNRHWIGIDITYQSISLILKRLQDRYPDQWSAIESGLLLDGIPRDLASARALSQRKDDKTRKEFEKWLILTYSNNQAQINAKKGADGGIDGTAYFMTGADSNGKAVIQVKSGKVGRGDIAKLNSDRQREKAEIGIFLTLQEPTKPMIQEGLAVGVYRHPDIQRDDARIQIVTVEEVLAGKRLTLPMARSAPLKSAEALADDSSQLAFDLT